MFQIGIRKEALEANTSLDPKTDRVRVVILGHARRRPLLFDRFFEVVPLDERHADALRHSPRGEAVLPEGDPVVRRYPPPHRGDEVMLNGVLTQRLGVLPTPEAFAGILAELFRKGYGQDLTNC